MAQEVAGAVAVAVASVATVELARNMVQVVEALASPQVAQAAQVRKVAL